MANEFTDTNVTGSLGITGEVVVDERADHISTPAAGKGILWVKNTTPSTLIFTDDAGTDATIGAAGATPTEFADDVFRIEDETDDTKKLAFSVGAITTSTVRTITVPDADVDLGDVFPITGTPDGTKFLRDDKTWVTPAGGGDVSKVGTPADGQVGVWTGDGTIEGDSALTFDTTTDTLSTANAALTGDIVFDERADHASTPGAGKGYLWVKSDTPSSLIFTDDAGTDYDLTATGGSGDVSKVGTPVDGQIGVWTGDGTIEGDAALTFDTTDDTLVIGASGKLAFGAVDILSDSAGTTTLQNIDALDTTTEATIEAAIDTLANLTSIQGQSVTVSGTATISGTNTGDVSLSGTPDYITISGQTITRNAVDLASDITGTLPIANGGTGATSLDGASIPTYTSTSTLTNKRITPRTGSTASSATPTINTDNVDHYLITAQAADITSFTTNLSGTPTEGQKLLISITGTAARAITWGASFENGAVDLPTATITTQRLDVGFIWNTVTSKWRCMAAGPLS